MLEKVLLQQKDNGNDSEETGNSLRTSVISTQIKEYILSCLSLLLVIHYSAQSNLSSADIGRAIGTALATCTPKSNKNILFR